MLCRRRGALWIVSKALVGEVRKGLRGQSEKKKKKDFFIFLTKKVQFLAGSLVNFRKEGQSVNFDLHEGHLVKWLT